jgi:hypothetical protein
MQEWSDQSGKSLARESVQEHLIIIITGHPRSLRWSWSYLLVYDQRWDEDKHDGSRCALALTGLESPRPTSHGQGSIIAMARREVPIYDGPIDVGGATSSCYTTCASPDGWSTDPPPPLFRRRRYFGSEISCVTSSFSTTT